MNKTRFKFWSKFIESDIMERYKLLSTLPIFEHSNSTINGYISVTLLNSYLEDLIQTFKYKRFISKTISKAKREINKK